MSVFTTTEKVSVEDIDKNFKMKIRGFLRILQEAANRASTDVGQGISNIPSTHKTWILLYWRIKIIKRPQYGDELEITTWANSYKKLYSLRNFEIRCNDELIAIADSKWIYVDSDSHSILKISDDIAKAYETNKENVFEEEFKDRIKMPNDANKVLTYKIMKRDLDVNHHVNNISFLDIAIEAIPDETILNANEIYITYKKEIEYGDSVSCYIKDETVYLYDEEKNVLHGTITLK